MNRVIILLMTSIIITFGCLSISQISFAQQPVTLNITKLTGKEKIEISGNLEINAALKNFYKFTDKPLIEIDDQPLSFVYPVDNSDEVIVDYSLISITLTIKIPLSDTATKILHINLYSTPDTIKNNLNGSITYANKPNNLGDHINVGDIFYNNVTSTATVNGSKGFIKAEATSNE
jgi:hypothetical protein